MSRVRAASVRQLVIAFPCQRLPDALDPAKCDPIKFAAGTLDAGHLDGDDAEVMIIYSVSVTIDAAVESQWVDWMRRIHVPEVLQTGCFSEGGIYKLLDTSGEEPPTYVMQYHCPSIAEYHRYREAFAPALQKEHADRFSGRFRASRQLLEEIGGT